jgi:hypothetical protein
MNTDDTLIPASPVPAEASGHVAGRCAVASGSDSGIPYDEWQAQGGDRDGVMRTVCHLCDSMFPMDEMTEDDRCDNMCPHCIADRQNNKITHGGT